MLVLYRRQRCSAESLHQAGTNYYLYKIIRWKNSKDDCLWTARPVWSNLLIIHIISTTQNVVKSNVWEAILNPKVVSEVAFWMLITTSVLWPELIFNLKHSLLNKNTVKKYYFPHPLRFCHVIRKLHTAVSTILGPVVWKLDTAIHWLQIFELL